MKSSWEKLSIGTRFSFKTRFDSRIVEDFVKISGDDNPLHTDLDFALSKGFQGCLVHGMLLASCFSKLVGKFFLEDNNLYLSQTLNFRRPVFVGDTVLIQGSVISKSELVRTIEIDTIIFNEKGQKVLTGIATVKSTEL